MTRIAKIGLITVASAAILVRLTLPAAAHCQIPCGIYGDEARFQTIGENITTIEKSMTEIVALSEDAAANQNQIVRWVQNKDVHADAIAEIVTLYFLQQRIKVPAGDDPAYARNLALLHQLLVSSMKAKQTTDPAHVKTLRETLHAFEHSYFGRDKEEGSGKKEDSAK
ncbi:MAG: superoxide dismutase [Ni] [Verrucomicrobia bacterium]|nr:superoxide dismutase [Ni] [Verrucomicrobiota bacterium]MDA1088242.1 superoxide dismutase [Ni] [Verrucomicrobiota bacterium]